MSAMTEAERFYYAHAGYSWIAGKETRAQGRRRCARELAQAAQWAKDEGLVYVWEDDPATTEDDFEFPEDKAHVREHGAVGCILYRPCPEHGTDCKHAEHLASLWGHHGESEHAGARQLSARSRGGIGIRGHARRMTARCPRCSHARTMHARDGTCPRWGLARLDHPRDSASTHWRYVP